MLLLVLFALVALGTFSMVVATTSGGGANVVLIPTLILVFGMSPGEAIGTSFLALMVGSTVASFRFLAAGYLDLKRGVILGAFTVPGVVAGSLASYLAEGVGFRALLGVVVVGLAVFMVVRGPTGGDKSRESNIRAERRASPALEFTLMASVGFFVGFFGQGGGLILMPIMQFIGFPIGLALGTTRIIAIAAGGTALLTRLAVSQVNLVYGAALAAGTALGGFLGAKISTTLRVGMLRYVVATLIGILGFLLILSQPIW